MLQDYKTAKKMKTSRVTRSPQVVYKTGDVPFPHAAVASLSLLLLCLLKFNQLIHKEPVITRTSQQHKLLFVSHIFVLCVILNDPSYNWDYLWFLCYLGYISCSISARVVSLAPDLVCDPELSPEAQCDKESICT